MIKKENESFISRSVPAKILTIALSLGAMGCGFLNPSDSDDDLLSLAALLALSGSQGFDCTDDGLVWTENPTPQSGNWQSVTYGNGLFVTVGISGSNPQVATSPDGQTWTMRNAAGTATSWYSVSYGNGRFIAANSQGGGGDSQQIMTSTDGITWSRVSEPSDAYFFRSAVDDSGRFVVAPVGTSNPANELLVSSDGLSWSTVTTPFASNESHGNVSYGNGMFLIFNQTTKNESITSSDGTTWTTHTVPSGYWADTVYGNGRWVAVGIEFTANTLMYSENGIDGWTQATDPVTPGGNTQKNWISVAYGGGLYVAVNNQYDPPILRSTDGINWSIVPGLTRSFWSEIVYANGKFVAVSQDGKTMVSACD